jgi:hypothetical protein
LDGALVADDKCFGSLPGHDHVFWLVAKAVKNYLMLKMRRSTMFKKLLLLVFALLLAGAPNAIAAVGIFDFSEDIGNPGGTGGTRYVATDEYLILAGGGDIWGNSDQFHYAYNEVSGNIRFELAPAWDIGGTNDWAKIEAMLRVSTDADSVHWSSAARRGGSNDPYYTTVDTFAGAQWRATTGGGSSNVDWWGTVPQKVAAQRVVSGGYQVVQALVDYGSGWEAISTQLWPGLPDDLLVGAAVTSHDNNWLVQARIGEVAYTEDPGLIGVTTIGEPLQEPCGDVPGFYVTAAKLPVGWSFWDDGDGSYPSAYRQAEYLCKNGDFEWYDPATGPWTGSEASEIGSRVVELVNLYDSGGPTGGRWYFTGETEETFPGIDAFDTDPPEPADGDDDNQFGVLVEACIELTEGLHVMGGCFDDGVLLRIGGVEIGRVNAWNETGVWLFEAPVAGVYSLEAVGFEMGGGAGLELHEYLPDGTMILLGDVAAGGSAVYVPEPATIALLGFGGLSMLRIRRKR